MVERSFIGDLLKKHPAAHVRWPAEDLLTEATAAVLERVPALATSVASYLSGRAAPDDLTIETQREADEQRKVDLELCAEGRLLMVVEVKDHAPESGDQLVHYRDNLRERAGAEGAEAYLVYLCRLGAASPNLEGVRVVRWEDLGAHIEGWLKLERERLDASESFLVRDYIEYLKERDLLSTSPLPPGTELLRVVRDFHDARGSLSRFHKMLSERVERHWEPIPQAWARRDGGTREHWPSHFWTAYRREPETLFGQGINFEWILRDVDPENGAPWLAAGLIWRPEEGGPSPFEDEWVARMLGLALEDGFGRFLPKIDNRLYRRLELDALPRESLGRQADHAAEFVISTFSLLRDHAPHGPSAV